MRRGGWSGSLFSPWMLATAPKTSGPMMKMIRSTASRLRPTDSILRPIGCLIGVASLPRLGGGLFGFQRPQVDQDEHQGDGSDDDGKCDAVPQIEALEDLGVGEPADEGCGIGRATARHHIDGVEGEYCRHGFIDDYDEKDRPEQRDFDVAENRPPATSVHLRRLVILIRDQLEARQEEDRYQGPLFPSK